MHFYEYAPFLSSPICSTNVTGKIAQIVAPDKIGVGWDIKYELVFSSLIVFVYFGLVCLGFKVSSGKWLHAS